MRPELLLSVDSLVGKKAIRASFQAGSIASKTQQTRRTSTLFRGGDMMKATAACLKIQNDVLDQNLELPLVSELPEDNVNGIPHKFNNHAC